MTGENLYALIDCHIAGPDKEVPPGSSDAHREMSIYLASVWRRYLGEEGRQ